MLSLGVSLALFLYYAKKVVSFFLMPLPACLLLMLTGLLFVFLGTRQRLGKWLMAVGLLGLLLASNMRFSNFILAGLESHYPAIPEIRSGAVLPSGLKDCRAIVVLGSGNSAREEFAATTRMSESALGRIVEGVRLARVMPEARLIVSGPAEGNSESHGQLLARSAEALGIDAGRIRVIDTARDTHDEALAVARFVQGGRVALVTSAFHMPRAVALFKRAGIDVVPCPSDFKNRAGGPINLSNSIWDTESLGRTTLAVHEYLGTLWSRIRGQI